MNITIERPPIKAEPPSPQLPAEDIARRWLQQRTGASPSLAETYRTLTGLGSYREAATR